MSARSLFAGCCVVLGFAVAVASASGAAVQGKPKPAPAESFATVDRTGSTASPADFARMRAIADREGRVRVIAGLRTSFTPEGALSKARRHTQHSAIDDATADVRRTLERTPHEVVHTYETVPYIALELSPKALDRLAANKSVATLQRDKADPAALGKSTGIVEVPENTAVNRGGSGGAVAILDTGVNKSHPFLKQTSGAAKVVSEACYSANSNCPGGVASSTASGSGVNCTYAADGCRHGTHVAGIAAGKGGVAPQGQLIAIQVFSQFTGANCAGAGEDPCALSFVSDQIKGLERVFALRDTFTIGAANMSIGGGQHTSACDTDTRKPIIDNLRSVRIPTVISSGNDGFSNAVSAPGCISTAITVGSTGDTDSVSLFSNSSFLVDLFAPGEQINSSVPVGTGPGGSDFDIFDGTSMAAPHVAGAWTVARKVAPTQTVTAVENAMEATGKPITDTLANPQITRDRIRAFSAGAYLVPTGFRVTEQWGPALGLSVASDGVGLARRTNANHNPTTPPPNRSFNITGIPAGAGILRSYVVYQTVGGPDSKFSFQGVNRTGTLIGGSGQHTCWNTNNGGAIRTYRVALPAGVVTGNGTYTIGGVGGANSAIHGRPDGQGASLVVIYDRPAASAQGRAYLRWGAMIARPGQPPMSHTFVGLSVPTAPTTRALHVGIGDGEAFSDPAMLFNGSPITPANFWSGSDGNYWDNDPITLPAASLPAGTTSRTNSQGATGECLTWAYAALTYR